MALVPSAKSMETAEPLDSPAFDAEVIAPNDSTEIKYTRAIYVGGTGHLNVVMVSGRTVLFSAIPAGTVLPISVKKVMNTSTTATLIVAMY